MEDKFKLFKKWFWIGIVVGFLNMLAGLVYGIALVMEPEHRKEGLIIVAWSVISFMVIFYIVSNIENSGLLPPGFTPTPQ